MAEDRAQRRSTARSDIGQYGMVPLWLSLSDVSGEAIKLFALIAAKYADHTGSATEKAKGFTRKDLAKDMHCSVATIDRLKKELVKAAAVEIEQVHNGGARLADIFHLWYADPEAPKRGEIDATDDDATPDGGDSKFADTRPEIPCESGENTFGGGCKSEDTSTHGCNQGGCKSEDPLKEPDLFPDKDSSNEESRATSQNDDPPDPIDAQARQLCEHLGQLLVATGEDPSIAEGKVTSERWLTSARRLLANDGRDFDQALRLLTWSLRDEFWSRNILSIPKFREKYEQLRRTAEADKRNPLDRVVVAALVRSERLDEAALRDLRADLWRASFAAGVEDRESFRSKVEQAEFSKGASGQLLVVDRGWLQMRYSRILTPVAENLGFAGVEFVPYDQNDQRRAA